MESTATSRRLGTGRGGGVRRQICCEDLIFASLYFNILHHFDITLKSLYVKIETLGNICGIKGCEKNTVSCGGVNFGVKRCVLCIH